MSRPVLRLEGLTRVFRTGEEELRVLDGVDLSIAAGEIVGLVGPSGSGKSSLLHAAGLLERPTGGQTWIDGVAAWGLDDDARTALRRSHIGFVYQAHHLLPEFDALDNVALPQLIAGVKPSAARAEAQRLLERMGLGGRLRHQPPQLSGGEQQRVAIARSLANKPILILADEPTGNLDPQTSAVVFQALRDLARHERVAALIATHNMELARHMDRVMALRDGKLEPLSA
ncbi:MAG: ABC transporter ATP-binding protein [Alphaproteobacteria bacterium]|jgi:lipoprotein-releasing system ATP-binding protein|nr:ABC transporter ATP-binding protein [Alphaproteobacteria bacterium]